jgi:hypothetical protein
VFESFILITSITAFVAETFTRTAVVFGASLYDIKHGTRQRTLRPLKKRRPAISVVVLAHNHGTSLLNCLDSLEHQTCRPKEVIIVDNASSDGTRQRISTYIKTHPQLHVVAIKKRRAVEAGVAIKNGVRKARGTLVFVMDGSSTVAPYTLEQIDKKFRIDSRLAGLVVAHKAETYPSIFSLLQRYETVVSNVVRKTVYIPTISEIRPDRLGAVYRKKSLRKIKNYSSVQNVRRLGKNVAFTYEPSIALLVPPIRSTASQVDTLSSLGITQPRNAPSSKLVETLSLLHSFLLPLIVTYFFYLAYTGRSNTLFLLSFFGFAVWVLLAVFSDSALNLTARIRLIIEIPALYVLLYIKAIWSAGSMCVRNIVSFLFLIKRVSFSVLRLGVDAA